MNFEHHYNESDWRDDENARDLARLAQEALEDEEVIIESTSRSTGGVFAKAAKTADEYLCTAGHCDGSGYLEEYFDVDQARAVRCPGCPRCEDEQKHWAEIEQEFAPEPKPIEIPAPVIIPRKVA